MSTFYYDTVARMEKNGVDRQYIDGCMCGLFHNPKRGPQQPMRPAIRMAGSG